MKKIFTLGCMSLLALTCATGCNKSTINADEAKEIAAEQIDGVLPEDLTDVSLVEGDGKKYYRIRYEESEYLQMRYEINIDANEEDILQMQSESLKAGQEGDIGMEEAKKVALSDVEGATNFDILYCVYSNGDYTELEISPYYDILLYKTSEEKDTLYSYRIDAANKTILHKEIVGEYSFDSTTTDQVGDVELTSSKVVTSVNADRPVWLTAHRCNTNYYNNWFSKQRGTLRPNEKRDTWIALNGGCNGVEVDIRHRRDGTLRLCHDNSCTINNSESVEDFLALPEMKDERMCVVIFDMKEPQYFQMLADIVHKELPNTKINFIYSIDKLKYAKQYFTDSFIKSLKPNEGICVDYHDSADEIEGLYTDLNFYRGWYGDGIFSGIASRATTRGCKRAIEIRNRTNPTPHIKRVENWTVNTERRFRDRLGGWGLDSVMLSGRMTKKASRVLGQVSGVHLAKQSEQMF